MERPIWKIFVSPVFQKNFEQLPGQIQILAEKKEVIFRKNAFHPSLQTHKLSGALREDWAYSVNKHYRVHFYFMDDHAVMYIDIGTHEIYK